MRFRMIPDELQSERLQALAGPSAGPNGGQIYIDGFTGGQLHAKVLDPGDPHQLQPVFRRSMTSWDTDASRS